MDLGEEHYCVRWKGKQRHRCLEIFEFSLLLFLAPSDLIYFPLVGFHSNIVSALEDLKSDESFVDVTLSCDGETIQVGIQY